MCRWCKNLRALSKKNDAFRSSFMQKKLLNSELQHHPAAAAMAAEISKTEKPPPTTATANGARENTGKLNAQSAALQALKGQLYDRSISRKKKKKAARQSR